MDSSTQRIWAFWADYLRPYRLRVVLLGLLLTGTIGVRLVNPQVIGYFMDGPESGRPLRVPLGLPPLQAGEVCWNGQRVSDLGAFFVPPRVAYTPQTPRPFSETLRDNILLGLPGNRVDLASAMRMAVLDPDVADMARGLDTQAGPRGLRLSGGQVQRTAAARMFVRQAELLVFDDLSSVLDVEPEQLL